MRRSTEELIEALEARAHEQRKEIEKQLAKIGVKVRIRNPFTGMEIIGLPPIEDSLDWQAADRLRELYFANEEEDK